MSWLKNKFGRTANWRQTRSAAADRYCWKEDTRVPDTQFELGVKPVRRNNAADWEQIWDHAKNGRIDEIPAQIRVNNYKTIKQVILTLKLRLKRITLNQLPMKRQLLCTGESQELESPEKLGMKQDWTPIQRTQTPNFGMATRAKKMSSLMNLEGKSTFPICSDGWTDIQSLWNVNLEPYPLKQGKYGSQAMSTPDIGTQIWTKKQEKLS